jgi:hypothetical protein
MSSNLDPNSPYYQANKFVQDQLEVTLNALAALEGSNVRTLNEYIFVNVFLPFFLGEENRYNATNELWTKVAGNPFAPVNIVNNEGAILFQVPPILNRGAVKSVTERGNGIADVIRNSELYARQHPVQGQHYLDTELRKRALIITTDAVNVEEAHIWNTICERYGYPALFDMVKKDSVAVSNESSQPSFDEYELS